MSVGSGILERIVQPEAGGFSRELAEYFLSLSMPEDVKNRYLVLSEKAQDGNLSDAEAAELDELLSADSLLTILKSKSRVSLKHRHEGNGADAGGT
jgi:hypothetical protein